MIKVVLWWYFCTLTLTSLRYAVEDWTILLQLKYQLTDAPKWQGCGIGQLKLGLTMTWLHNTIIVWVCDTKDSRRCNINWAAPNLVYKVRRLFIFIQITTTKWMKIQVKSFFSFYKDKSGLTASFPSINFTWRTTTKK